MYTQHIVYRDISLEYLEQVQQLRLQNNNFHVQLDPDRYVDCSKDDPSMQLQSGQYGVLAFQGEEPVGIIFGYFSFPGDRTTGVATIVDLFVVDKFRRQGIGSELIKRFRTASMIKGAHTLRLGVLTKNLDALRFYYGSHFECKEIKLEMTI